MLYALCFLTGLLIPPLAFFSFAFYLGRHEIADKMASRPFEYR